MLCDAFSVDPWKDPKVCTYQWSETLGERSAICRHQAVLGVVEQMEALEEDQSMRLLGGTPRAASR